MKCEIAIIGGGPAGLAAAVAAKAAGVSDILVLERENELGGILNQCIHNGFGLHMFKEELTGPEYAGRYIEKAREAGIACLLSTTIVDIDDQKVITAVSREKGLMQISAKAIVLAMGCRERPRGALRIPGFNPAGVFSAGTAQKLVNIEGYLPGREVVILGSGDIGLIMARRLTLEGAKVKLVAEIQPYSGGLKRNIVQCLDDYGIPLKLSHTVTQIHGKDRVEAVTVAEVDERFQPIAGSEEVIPCDTLMLSVGLIPENELSEKAGVMLHHVTNGPKVNSRLQTNVEGIFACGNVLHVHDLVDYVSEEAAAAGRSAAEYIMGIDETHEIPVKASGAVRYAVPMTVQPTVDKHQVMIRFRVGEILKNAYICVYADDRLLSRKKRPIMQPGEMEQTLIHTDMLGDAKTLTICTESGEA